jgi:hypothetical protein
MAGLVPAIHVFLFLSLNHLFVIMLTPPAVQRVKQDVDGRNKSGHDEQVVQTALNR